MKQRTLRAQALEPRALLAVDVKLDLLSGELRITGSASGDVVEVSQDLTHVHVTDSTGGAPNVQSFPGALVTSVIFRGGDGDDHFVMRANLPAAIHGQAGNDTLIGGDVADVLYGEDGDDILRGGAGDDRLLGEEGLDQLFGDDGADRLEGGGGDDKLRGGAGADYLLGGLGVDKLYGDDGDDQLVGSEHRDFLYGGLGDDILRGGDARDYLYGNEGNDQLFGDAGSDVLQGNDGHDTLTGDVGNDQLSGGAGNDTLDGGTGDDVLKGDDDNDLLMGREGNDQLYGGAGNDDLRGDDGFNLLLGEDGDDTLTGGALADDLRGGAGNDVLRGGGGDDLLLGEAGLDKLYGGDGDDQLNGGLDADELYGDAGDDLMYGGAGNDLLDAGAGNDLLFGNAGDDIMLGREGDDRLYGGAGNDDLRGDEGADQLYGEEDDDSINGGDGPDLIRGDNGNDTLLGGAGSDNINGGDGNDDIQGNDGDDVLMGGRGDDVIRGGWGFDHLRGLDGNDTLYGDQDADILVGGLGDDTLIGGAAADLLIGGLGADWLGGNDGGDLLVGGTTIYDDSASSLRAILSNWNGAVVFQDSAERFRQSQSSITLRPFDTVIDDNAADWLDGDDDRDWFFWFTSDTMADRRQDETITGGDLSSSAWIKRLYLDLLGRLPTEAELQLNDGRLQIGLTGYLLPLNLLRDADYQSARIRDAYRQTFGQDITPTELSAYLAAWNQLGGGERIWAHLLGSDAFYQAHGANDRTALQAMFNIVSRRTASELELDVWLEGLSSVDRAQLAYDLITSDEVRVAWVNDRYRDYLHRAPDEGEIDYWLGQFRKGVTTEEMQARLLAGDAYLNQPYFVATDFGARPNDALDDTSALQAALDLAGAAGNSVLYLGQGTYVVENLRLYHSNTKLIGPGTLKLRDRSSAVGVLTVEGNFNVVSYLNIDGNRSGEHTGRALGLRVIGNDNRVFRVTVSNTLFDMNAEPAGGNFMIGGARNTLIETKSYNAGHSGYRQIGVDNLYRDIVGINARVKGFNGMGDGSSFTVDGGYFETNAPEHELGVNSFQVDPGFTGKRVRRAVLRNVVAKGPENSGPWTTNVAKFAVVDEIVIENSSFLNRAENIYSLRFAEGVGKVLLRDVFLSRAMYMEQDTHDGSGLRDPMDELVMQRVTIGDGVHRPTFAMEEVEVGHLVIDDCRFIGYTVAGIDWEAPEAEYTSISVTNTLFRGWNPDRATYDIFPNDGGQLLNAGKRYWHNIKRRNGGGGGALMMP